MFGVISNLIGMSMEQRAMDRRAAEANAAAIQQQQMANRANVRASNVAWNRSQRATDEARAANRQDATRDFRRNLQAARQNSATDYKRGIAAMDRANAFTVSETDRAREHDANLRAAERELALDDQDQQFVRMREAAEKAGLNPLSVIGAASMTPQVSALQSSSFGSSAGIPSGATPFAPSLTPGAVAPTPSVPMSYGAEVFVAPVASNAAVLGSLAELGQQLTSPLAVGKANGQLAADIAKVESEKAESEALIARQPFVPSVGTSVGSLAPPVDQAGNLSFSLPSLGGGGDYGADYSGFEGRPLERDPVINTPAVMQVQMPGEDEPYNLFAPGGSPDVEEIIGAGIQIGPEWVRRRTLENMPRSLDETPGWFQGLTEFQNSVVRVVDPAFNGQGQPRRSIPERPNPFNWYPGAAGSPLYP